MVVSIKDIARLAGVSHSTVSRALRGSPLIPEATRARIQKIATANGYSASAVARSLVTRKTHSVGVIVTSIADPFNGEIVSGLETTANASGYSVLLATSQADPERELAIVKSFAERRVDGLIVASSRVGAPYLERLTDLPQPLVLLNNQGPGRMTHSVRIDNVSGAAHAVRHLLTLGHTNVAYLGDASGMQSDAERYAGFERAMKAAGVAVRQEFVVRGDGKPMGARETALGLLGLKQPPSALFCYNDMSALGVMDAARQLHLRIPEDLSLCGFDDLFFTPYLHPALTTLRQPKRTMGELAMQLLIDLLSGKESEKEILVQGELIVRASTAPPHHHARRAGKNSATKSL